MLLGSTLCHRAMMAALKEARIAAGITGRALSLKLRKPYNYVSKVETGERMPNYCEVMQLVDAIGADPVQFAARVVELMGPRRRARRRPVAE